MDSGHVSVRDVAAKAGVSVGTVSNAMNRPELVAPDTLTRVHDAIAQLGFVRNESARQLRAGSSRTIGLVVLDITNPFFTDVARGVEDAANEAGRAVILCNSDERSDKEASYLDVLEQQRVQGILITPVDMISDHLQQLRDRGMPIVLVDRRATTGGQCSVSVDDVLGGDMAVSHLLNMGHKNIAYVGGPFSLRQVQDRYDGAVRAIDRVSPDAALTAFKMAALNTAAGVLAGTQLLALDTRPTAVFCANDLLALGVLQEAIRQGCRVPEELAIVGYDDIQFAASASHPLSSVSQPRRMLGRTAAQLLLEERSDTAGHRHQCVVFQPELVVRASSDYRRTT